MVAAVIHSFETLLDVFAYDISETINNRINGTPEYYARALLRYQKGDELTVREDGLAFGYASVDESKQIITQVSYSENTDDENLDSKLVLKVATGEKGNLSAIGTDELVQIRSYLQKIKFAGTRVEVTSLPGDILIPRLSVYWDGAIAESDVLDGIEEKLDEYMMNIEFNAAVYVSKVMEAIRSAEHVTDVWIDETATPAQGVFLVCYDSDAVLQPLQKVQRVQFTTSGYLRQSSGKGDEETIPTFREALKLTIDGQ